MANKTEVEVRAEDRTAKLIMGMLVDCGVAFSYRRVPGQTCAAVVSVASRNGATLLKIHDVVRDRLKRASTLPPPQNQPDQDGLPVGYTVHFDWQLGYWWHCKISDTTGGRGRSLEECKANARKDAEQNPPKASETLPKGYTVHTDSQVGSWFTFNPALAGTVGKTYSSAYFATRAEAIHAARCDDELGGA